MPYDLEEEYLHAAYELSLRGTELWPRVAAAIGDDPHEYWIVRRGEPAKLKPVAWDHVHVSEGPDDLDNDGEWGWYFHGLELDVIHLHDRRRVRIDFAKHRAQGVFTGWGVVQFVRSSRPPWPQYPRLARLLSEELTAELDRALHRDGYFAPVERPYGTGYSNVITAKATEYLKRMPRYLCAPIATSK